MNNKEPSTDPCGTPETTGTVEEVAPSRTTCCVRPIRKAHIHCSSQRRFGMIIMMHQ